MEVVMLAPMRKRQAEAEVIAPPAKRIADADREELLTVWDDLCVKVGKPTASVRAEVELAFYKLKARKATFVQLIKTDDLLIDLLAQYIEDSGSLGQFICFANALELEGVYFDSVSKMNQVMLLLVNDAPECRDHCPARFESTKRYDYFSWLSNRRINPLILHTHEVDSHPTTLVFEALEGQRSDYPIHERSFFQFLVRRFGNPIIDIANNASTTLIDFAVKALENHPSQLPVSYPVLERVLYSICRTRPDAVHWDCRATSSKHVFSPNETKQALTLLRQLCVDPSAAIQIFNESVAPISSPFVTEPPAMDKSAALEQIATILPPDIQDTIVVADDESLPSSPNDEGSMDIPVVLPPKDMLDVDLLNSSDMAKVIYQRGPGTYDLSPAVWRRIKDAKLRYWTLYDVPRTDQLVARFVEDANYQLASPSDRLTSSGRVVTCKVPIALIPYINVSTNRDGSETVGYNWRKVYKALVTRLTEGRFKSLDEVTRYVTRLVELAKSFTAPVQLA